MSCDCTGTSPAAASASPSIASQLDALTLALFGSPTKTVVDGRVVWTNVCAASLPYIVGGVSPLEGEGLLCYLLRALKEVPNAILPGILTFTDAAARAAAAPQYVGQLGTQQDTNELFIGTGIVAGDWDLAPPFAGIKVFADAAARALTVPDFEGQLGTQKDTDEVYVAIGTNAGDWIIAQTQTSGAFLQDSFVGTGAQTAFTLTQDPGSIVNTTVFVDGVYQNRTDAYGVSGTTLTFTEAPASGAVIQVTIGSMAVTSVVPDDLSVTAAKLAVTIAQSLVPTGAVQPFAMASAPTGWLACDGSAVSRATYATLFTAISTTYGVGDGSTTFNVPDLRGYFVRGLGTNTDGAASGALGAKVADTFKAHTHPISGAGGSSGGFGTLTGSSATVLSGSTGGAETMPKNIALFYCIKT